MTAHNYRQRRDALCRRIATRRALLHVPRPDTAHARSRQTVITRSLARDCDALALLQSQWAAQQSRG